MTKVLSQLMGERTGTCVKLWTRDIRYKSLAVAPFPLEGTRRTLSPVVEALGMWKSRRDLQRVREWWEASFMAFHTPLFPWPVLPGDLD